MTPMHLVAAGDAAAGDAAAGDTAAGDAAAGDAAPHAATDRMATNDADVPRAPRLHGDLPLVAVCLGLLCLYLGYAAVLKVEQCPDEYMRYTLAYYLYGHGTLPIGDEPEIVSPIWGFSYAYTPYLPCIIAAVLMRFFALFSASPAVLIFAARIPSAVSGALCAFAVGKTADLVWGDRRTSLLAALIVGLLPQYVFLSSYLNEDAMATCGVALCLWAWARAWRAGKFTPRICVHLGAAIGLVALTYYNAYGIILASILFFFAFERTSGVAWREVWMRAALVFAVAFGLAGWFFVRNIIIRQGDIFAMRSLYALGEERAPYEYQLPHRPTPLNLHQGLRQTFGSLGPTSWAGMTLSSFLCYVGYMEFRLDAWVQNVYLALFGIGLLATLVIWGKKYSEEGSEEGFPHGERSPLYLKIALAIVVVTPIILSMRYSYAIDFSPQGRYLMSMLPVLALVVAGGYRKLALVLEARIGRQAEAQPESRTGTVAERASKGTRWLCGAPILIASCVTVALFVYCAACYLSICVGPAFAMETITNF